MLTAGLVPAPGFSGEGSGVLAFALHLGWQVAMIDPSSTERSLRLFRSNRDAGLILFAGLSLQGLFG